MSWHLTRSKICCWFLMTLAFVVFCEKFVLKLPIVVHVFPGQCHFSSWPWFWSLLVVLRGRHSETSCSRSRPFEWRSTELVLIQLRFDIVFKIMFASNRCKWKTTIRKPCAVQGYHLPLLFSWFFCTLHVGKHPYLSLVIPPDMWRYMWLVDLTAE